MKPILNKLTVYEASGGPVRIGAALYVERAVDTEFAKDLLNRRNLFIITAPRQTGKTSLWVKTQHELTDNGFTCGTVDFREVFGLPEESTQSSNGWIRTLFRALCREFGLEIKTLNQWLEHNEDISTTNLIASFFSKFLRESLQGPLMIAMDEIDVVQLYHHFTDSLFEAFRVLSAKRDELDMSFILIGRNSPAALYKSLPGSGFNAHEKPIQLMDFDPDDEEAIVSWSRGLSNGSEQTRLDISHRILTATGGQPFLSACLLAEIKANQIETLNEVDQHIRHVISMAKEGEWHFNHFKSPEEIILNQLNSAYQVLDEYKKLLCDPGSTISPKASVRVALLTSGLVKEDPRNKSKLILKSRIYREVLDAEWVASLMRRIGGDVFADSLSATTFIFDQPRRRVCIINTGGMISTEIQPDGSVGIPPRPYAIP